MNNLAVGDQGCTFNDILLALWKHPSVGKLADDWKKLSMALRTDSLKEKELQADFTQGRKRVLELMKDLLEEWRSSQGTNAKFVKLLDVLEHECGWKDLADHLWETIKTGIITEHTSWNDLDKRTRAKILKSTVKFMGTENSLTEILNRVDSTKRKGILGKYVSGPLILKLLQNDDHPIVVASETPIPEIPNYYIPRTLSSRRRIDPEIFQKTCSDIFIVENIEIWELSRIAGNQRVDRSTHQLDRLTVRFMVMEFYEDFDGICKKAEHFPVHLLRHENGQFHWIRSCRSMNLIQSFLHKDQELISEDQLLLRSKECKERLPICFADSPGMGKSLLLASLCCKLKNVCPKNTFLFFNLAKLLQDSEFKKEIETNGSVLDLLAQRQSANELGRNILFQCLSNSEEVVQLFLDGFDELKAKEIQMATKLIQCLTIEHTNIRIHVASRMHRREQLEELLGTLSFNICPLQEPDQVRLLEQFWIHKSNISTNENLKKFASELISNIRSTVSSKDCDVAGIPLQCTMLGDIYVEDARKHANASYLKFGVSVRVRSIHDMYQQLIEKRFQEVDTGLKNKMKVIHQIAAVTLLFPYMLPIFEDHFGMKIKEIEELANVNRVGIMTAHRNIPSSEQLTFNFVHLTYAEFILAELFVESVRKSKVRNEDVSFGTQLAQFLHFGILELFVKDTDVLVWREGYSFHTLWKDLSISPQVNDCRSNWANIARGLNMSEEDIIFIQERAEFWNDLEAEEVQLRDPLLGVLVQWTDNCTTPRRLNELVEVLCTLNLTETAEVLKAKWSLLQTSRFQHETLCFFVDASLAAYNDSRNTSSFIEYFSKFVSEQLEPKFSSFYLNCQLEASIVQNYASLFTLLSRCCLSLKADSLMTGETWTKLALEATEYSSLNLLQECCEFVEAMHGEPLEHIMGFGVTLFGPSEWIPLHEACRRGDYSIFLYLVQKFGVRVQQTRTLLHSCTAGSIRKPSKVVAEKIQIATELLGVNPEFLEEKEPKTNETPILMDEIHFEILKFLIDSGANPLAVDAEGGLTAVHKAARYLSSDDFHQLTSLLLEKGHGEVFLLRNKNQQTPLHAALQFLEIKPETVELAVSCVKIDPKSAFDWDQALYAAVTGGQERRILKLVVEAGARPCVTGAFKQGFVHLAAHFGNVEALEYFVSLGLKVNGQDKKKRTPLHLALTQGIINVDQVVRVLLENGASVNAVDDKGHTPKWYAETRRGLRQLQPGTQELLNKFEEQSKDECDDPELMQE